MKRALLLALFASALGAAEPTTTVWKLDQASTVGGLTPSLIGTPRVVEEDGAKAMVFDGAHDGILLPAVPLAGWKAFTVEILFRPAEGGLAEQRFVHVQDNATKWRLMIETRLDAKGGWWLDTYLGGNASPLTLIEPKLVHPTDRWYWAALRYDGKHMTSFVNGAKELEGDVAFGPMGAGQTSLGVRQNKVFWFKGAIREVRFSPTALADEKLQRVKE